MNQVKAASATALHIISDLDESSLHSQQQQQQQLQQQHPQQRQQIQKRQQQMQPQQNAKEAWHTLPSTNSDRRISRSHSRNISTGSSSTGSSIGSSSTGSNSSAGSGSNRFPNYKLLGDGGNSSDSGGGAHSDDASAQEGNRISRQVVAGNNHLLKSENASGFFAFSNTNESPSSSLGSSNAEHGVSFNSSQPSQHAIKGTENANEFDSDDKNLLSNAATSTFHSLKKKSVQGRKGHSYARFYNDQYEGDNAAGIKGGERGGEEDSVSVVLGKGFQVGDGGMGSNAGNESSGNFLNGIGKRLGMMFGSGSGDQGYSKLMVSKSLEKEVMEETATANCKIERDSEAEDADDPEAGELTSALASGGGNNGGFWKNTIANNINIQVIPLKSLKHGHSAGSVGLRDDDNNDVNNDVDDVVDDDNDDDVDEDDDAVVVVDADSAAVDNDNNRSSKHDGSANAGNYSTKAKILQSEAPTRRKRSIQLNENGVESCTEEGTRIGLGSESGESESLWSFALQSLPTFLIAGLGLLLAGVLFDTVQHWSTFESVSELFILVPALLGLKGNLEMTLVCRLSTAVAQGTLKNSVTRWNCCVSNMALVAVQATIVGAVAAIYAAALGLIVHHQFDWSRFFLLFMASMFTALISGIVLGALLLAIVVYSRKCNINPNNIATPLAASLGDLVTLAVLSISAQAVFKLDTTTGTVLSVIFALFFLALLPFWIKLVKLDASVATVLVSGWPPILAAMVISSFAGLILERKIGDYPGIAALIPILCGIGGNMAAVQASRLSTSLILHGQNNDPNYLKIYFLLNSLVVPLQLVLLYIMQLFEAGHTSLTLRFVGSYLVCCVLQVFSLLLASHFLVHFLYKRKMDTDTWALPLITGIGDVIGTSLLVITFGILFRISDGDEDVGE